MDMDRLGRFAGVGLSESIPADGAVARATDPVDGDAGETQEVALDYYWANKQVCCAGLSPIDVGCGCAPLK